MFVNIVFSAVSSLQTYVGPVLTWYRFSDADTRVLLREELGGPVLARWLCKTANLLGTDLADLFAEPNEPRTLAVDMPGTWQEVVWILSAAMMGWDVCAAQESDGDVFVTNRLSEDALEQIRAGADVLFHDTTPLALSWRCELPSGSIDAIEAVMSQPDGLIVDPSDCHSAFLDTQHVSALPQGRHLLLSSEQNLGRTLLNLWLQGGSAVVIPDGVDAEKIRRIQAEEKTS